MAANQSSIFGLNPTAATSPAGALIDLASEVAGLLPSGSLGVHKATHVSGGTDAFTSSDLLEAAVKRLQESAGPTTLTLGAVADGEMLSRVGTTIVGTTALVGDQLLGVRNETGSAIPAGTLVAVTGFSVAEDRGLVSIADKDNAALRPAIGVTTASFPNNSNADVMVIGTLTGVNTSAFTINDQLVLGSAGAFSRPPPNADPFTGEIQLVGSITRVDATLGSIFVTLASGLLPMTAAHFFAARETSPSGGVTGGNVTRATGLNVDVAAGSGFVNNNVDVFRVTWSAVTNLALAANDTSSIFVDKNGLVQTAVSPPDLENNIVLADGITDGSSVLLLANHQVLLPERPAKAHQYVKDVVGNIVVSGVITAKDAIALRLEVATGTFYIRDFRVTVPATDPITFTYWFRDGSGGFTRVAGSTLIDKDNFDDGSGTLVALVATEFKKDLLFVVPTASGTVEYHVFYGQEKFTSQSEAEAGNLPAADGDVIINGVQSGGVVIEGASATIASVVDVRPFLGQLGPGTTAVTDHGLLSGLGDVDDHPGFAVLDGARAFTGTQNLGGNAITNVGLVDGVDVSAHKARHVSGGADAFAATDLLEAAVKRLEVTGPTTLTLGAVADGEVLKRSGTTIIGTTVAGDVVGPASATDNAIARFDTTTGKLIQNSGVTISDSAQISAPGAGADSEIFGSGSVAAGIQASAFGKDASGGGNDSAAFGAFSSATAADAAAFGGGAAAGFRGTAIGGSADATATNATAVGRSASALADSIALGHKAFCTVVNQFVVGSLESPITNVIIGRGVTGTVTTVSMSVTGGTADLDGSALTWSGGAGGVASATAGGVGGVATYAAGTGGAGTAGLKAGGGGNCIVAGGSGGVDNGGGGEFGGDLILRGGAQTTGVAGEAGQLLIGDQDTSVISIGNSVDNPVVEINGTVSFLVKPPASFTSQVQTVFATDGDSILALFINSQAAAAASVNETAQIRFGFGTNQDVARIVVGKVNDYTSAALEDSFMAFFTDLNGVATEGARIDENGALLIGATTSSGTEKLRVIGDVRGEGDLVVTGTINVSTLVAWTANDALFPAANPMAATSRGATAHALLAADDTTAENVIFEGTMTDDYGAGSIRVDIHWVAATATTGDVKWNVEFERIGTALDIDADSFAAAQTTTNTTNATSGIVTITTVTLTQAQADGLAAGEAFRLRLTRDAAAGGDTLVGDAQVLRVMVEQ